MIKRAILPDKLRAAAGPDDPGSAPPDSPQMAISSLEFNVISEEEVSVDMGSKVRHVTHRQCGFVVLTTISSRIPFNLLQSISSRYVF